MSKWIEYQPKSKKNTCSFYTAFQVLDLRLIEICKIQSLDLLFLVTFISFYINRYHFPQIFYSALSEREIFVTNISLLTESLKPPTPLNGQNPRMVTRTFC